MKIVHELNQLDYGGVERVIKNIIKFDKENQHSIIAYKDGEFRKELESVGAEILLVGEDNIKSEADVFHIHSGGGMSQVALQLHKEFPIVEAIHSPIRSPIRPEFISQKIGVSRAVSVLNPYCKTIYNGLDFQELEAKVSREKLIEALGLDPNLPTVGRLGRLGFDKGLEEWILTCYYLQKKGYAFNALIVGPEAADAKGYIGKLKLMVASLPVRNLFFYNLTTKPANLYQLIDIFLYPSATEGFGLVIAEAMFCGCAVISYKTDVNMELFGGYANLVNQKDGIPGLVTAVQSYFQYPEIMQHYKDLAYEYVVSEFQAERMSNEYCDLYKEVKEKYDTEKFSSHGENQSQKEHALST